MHHEVNKIKIAIFKNNFVIWLPTVILILFVTKEIQAYT